MNKLHKRLGDTNQTDNIFSSYLLLNMFEKFIEIFDYCVFQAWWDKICFYIEKA